MSFYIPPPQQDPLLRSFVNFVNYAQEQRRQEEAMAKESGAALSASGAAGGAATGAAIGTSILPGVGTLIGAGIGAAGGSVLGKYTSPRMKPGEGPYAQPGNIQQDNAAIMQGLLATAGQVAGAFAKQKDIEDKGKVLDSYADFLDGIFQQTGGGTEQQRLAALDAFVGEIPENDRPMVGQFLQHRMSQAMPSGRPGAFRLPEPHAAPDGRSGGMPPLPIRGSQPSPQQAAQQAQQVFGQLAEQAGVHFEYSKQDQQDLARLNNAVAGVMRDDTFSPDQKVAFVQKATQQARQIRKRPSIRPRPQTIDQLISQGQIKQVAPNTYMSFNPKTGALSSVKFDDPRQPQYPVGQSVGQVWQGAGPFGNTLLTRDHNGDVKELATLKDGEGQASKLLLDTYFKSYSALKADMADAPAHAEVVRAANQALAFAAGVELPEEAMPTETGFVGAPAPSGEPAAPTTEEGKIKRTFDALAEVSQSPYGYAGVPGQPAAKTFTPFPWQFWGQDRPGRPEAYQQVATRVGFDEQIDVIEKGVPKEVRSDPTKWPPALREAAKPAAMALVQSIVKAFPNYKDMPPKVKKDYARAKAILTGASAVVAHR